MSRIATLIDGLFGFDMFVSYARADGTQYATALLKQLQMAGFRVFMDTSGLPVGEELAASLTRAVRRSSMLVLVASQHAMNSNWVYQELDVALKSSRRVLPIDVDRALVDASEQHRIRASLGDRIWVTEHARDADDGPSAAVFKKIVESVSFTRRETVRARVLLSVTVLFILLAAAAAVFAYRFAVERREAEQARQGERAGRLVVEARDLIEKDPTQAATRLMEAFDLREEGDVQVVARQWYDRRLMRGIPVTGAASTVAVSPDGQWLFAPELDGSVQVWSTRTWRRAFRLPSVTPPVNGGINPATKMAVTPDGERLAVAFSNGRVAAWQLTDVGHGTLIWEANAHSGLVYGLAWQPNGAVIATVGADRRLVVIGGFTGTVGQVIPLPEASTSVAISDDGSKVACLIGQGRILLSPLSPTGGNGQVINLPSPGAQVTWTPTGELVVGFVAGTVTLSGPPPISQQNFAEHTLVSATGSMVVRLFMNMGHLVIGSLDGSVRIFRMDDRSRIPMLIRTPSLVSDLASAMGEDFVAVASVDSLIRIFKATTRRRGLESKFPDGDAWAIAWSPDGRRIAIGNGEGAVYLGQDEDSSPIPGQEGSRHPSIRCEGDTEGVVRALKWSNSGTWLAAASSSAYGKGRLRVWDTRGGCSIVGETPAFDDIVNSLAFRPDDEEIVVGLLSGGVSRWRRTNLMTPIWQGAEQFEDVNAVEWVTDGPQGRLLGGYRTTQALLVWAPGAEGDAKKIDAPTANAGSTLRVVASPQLGRAVISFGEGGLVAFDLASQQVEWSNSQTGVTFPDLAFNAQGTELALAGTDGVLLIVDPKTGRIRSRYLTEVEALTSVAWKPDGGSIAVGGIATRRLIPIVSFPSGGELRSALQSHIRWAREVAQ